MTDVPSTAGRDAPNNKPKLKKFLLRYYPPGTNRAPPGFSSTPATLGTAGPSRRCECRRLFAEPLLLRTLSWHGSECALVWSRDIFWSPFFYTRAGIILEYDLNEVPLQKSIDLLDLAIETEVEVRALLATSKPGSYVNRQLRLLLK